MKRKILIGVLLSISLMPTAFAKENYFVNDNGVSFSKKEYDFFGKMYWDGYQEFVSQDEYFQIKDMDLFDKEIKKETTYTDSCVTYDSSVTSNLRTLKITKACSSSCYSTMVTDWNETPFIKSYDVMGARLNGPSLLNVNNLIVTGDNYYQSYNNPKKFTNGFGYSFLLPSISNIRVTTSFITSLNGTLYGSYQHAMSNTNSAVSNQYTIGVGGYGNVFQFTGTARNVYDNAPGVDINL